MVTRPKKTYQYKQQINQWAFQQTINALYWTCFINPFVPNAPFTYPLKTSENLQVFWYFQGVEKGRIRNKWFNITSVKLVQHPSFFPIIFIHFSPALHFIQKPVISFAMQIKWLVSIWNARMGWNGLIESHIQNLIK